jgi:hypothetical protein
VIYVNTWPGVVFGVRKDPEAAGAPREQQRTSLIATARSSDRGMRSAILQAVKGGCRALT